jgi:hypothetical protein
MTSKRFFVEFDAEEACPLDFEGDAEIVLFFASWAFSVRYGGMHELAQAAMRLQRQHKLDLGPLLRYADREATDAADRAELERAWQEAAPLAACCRAVAEAWQSGDAELDALAAGYEQLAPRLLELAAMCDWAAEREARVRITFDLRTDERRASRPADPMARA